MSIGFGIDAAALGDTAEALTGAGGTLDGAGSSSPSSSGRPDGPHVDVRLQGLASPGAFQVVVEELAARQPEERAAFLRETAPRLLTEDLTRHRTSPA
jgi:hypothetical protein